ncbi:aldo/keto reductase [Flagellimonas sp. CMM7]|uniref:aldo/keto reductase n=1 Tax=Flagellimonas sp. CMM7 TaxID=2654676 RepID=UPI0013D45A37|nr:aldo/keto reductase [Flagellimonas sp. CMM7]UII80337.1 aldo/keto reductase [Flagellimonas sp. CMM7]
MKYKKYTRLNNEALPAIGFGCWSIGGEWNNIEDSKSIRAIHTALDLGVNFFDTAPVYGKGHSETVLGKALKGSDRSKLFIASKCGLVWGEDLHVDVNLTRESLLKEIDRSLTRLGVDYLDVWQCHWPDKDTDLKETIEAMEEIKEMGKIRYIGLSNYSLEQLKYADSCGEVASFQGLYNMFEHNPDTYHGIPLTYKTKDEILPYCRENGLMYLPYSPLFQGLLTGSFKAEGNFDENDKRSENPKLLGETLLSYLKIVDDLKVFAKEIDRPLSQITINWLVAQKEVGPIIAGLDHEKYAKDTVASLEWELTAEMQQQIAEILGKYDLDKL